MIPPPLEMHVAFTAKSALGVLVTSKEGAEKQRKAGGGAMEQTFAVLVESRATHLGLG